MPLSLERHSSLPTCPLIRQTQSQQSFLEPRSPTPSPLQITDLQIPTLLSTIGVIIIQAKLKLAAPLADQYPDITTFQYSSVIPSSQEHPEYTLLRYH